MRVRRHSQRETQPGLVRAGSGCVLFPSGTSGGLRTAVLLWLLFLTATRPLSGQQAEDLVLTPSSVQFGEVSRLTSADQGILIRNRGSVTVSLTALAVEGDSAFSLVAGGAPGTLRPGDERLATVRCRPTTTQSRPARGEFLVYATGFEEPWKVSLECQGIGPEILLSDGALEFGFVMMGEEATRVLRVTNVGNQNLVLLGVDRSPSDFLLDPEEWPDVLVPDAYRDVQIGFSPIASGVSSGSIIIQTNTADSPHSVLLTGTGVSSLDPKLSISAASLDFGGVEVGSERVLSLTIMNEGGGVLTGEITLGAGADAAGFGLPEDPAPIALPSGDSVVVAVRFAPLRTGIRTATLAISHNAYNLPTPFDIPLTGTGRPPALAAPQLLSPPDGAEAVARPVALSWNPVGSATDYRIEVDDATDFLSPVLVRTDVLGTTTVVTGLGADKTYTWRVRADGQSGPGSWSATWHFSTAPLPPGPAELLSPRDGEEGIVTPATLSWAPAERASSYEVEVAEDAAFAAPIVDRTGIMSTSVTDIVLEADRLYHWRVRAVNAGGEGPWRSAAFRTYPATLLLDAARTFGPLASASYRMVSLPGAVDVPISATVSGDAGKDWNAYLDNGRASDYLVEYDGSVAFRFKTGKAFWLHAIGSWRYQGSVPTAAIDGSKQASIPLQPGWNQVGNPFERPVRWADVQVVNDAPDVLWRFEGAYSESGSMEPYRGYYFFNRDGRSSLEIPYPGGSPAIPVLSASDDGEAVSDWLRIKVTSPEGGQSRIEIGFREGASDGLDGMDQFQPPGLFGGLNAGVLLDSEPSAYLLARDIRPHPSSGAFYRLRIARSSPGPIDVSAEKPVSWAALAVALIDAEDGLVHRIDEQAAHLASFRGEREMVLLVGPPGYIADREASLAPVSPRLRPLYPNPSGGVVQVEFGVPEPMDVRIEVFSVDGRRVADLAAGRFAEGWHRIQWAGAQDTGGEAAPGLYLVRLAHAKGTVSRSVIIQ